MAGKICINGTAWPDCNPSLSLGIPVILLCHTQPVEPSSAVTNTMHHYATAHITPGKQQTMPENRLLHAAVEVITDVTMCKSLLLSLRGPL